MSHPQALHGHRHEELVGAHADHRGRRAYKAALCAVAALPAGCSHGSRPLRGSGCRWVIADVARVRVVCRAARAHACMGTAGRLATLGAAHHCRISKASGVSTAQPQRPAITIACTRQPVLAIKQLRLWL